MTDYECGHSQDLLILDDNPLSISAYLEWNETVGRDGTKELCFKCWTNKSNSTELTCDKTREPPCHLEPSKDLCQKCSLNKLKEIEGNK